MKFKTAYDRPKKVSQTFLKPSLTDQQFKQECDIGFIVENYAKLGKSFENTNANYFDCTQVQDYQSAQLLVAECKSNFEMLPSKDRDRFKTVENYLEFISNQANLKESYEKGYIDRSTVDIADVYPERYKVSKEEQISPSVNSSTDNSAISDTSEKAG